MMPDEMVKILGLLPPDTRGSRRSYHIRTVEAREAQRAIDQARAEGHTSAYAVPWRLEDSL